MVNGGRAPVSGKERFARILTGLAAAGGAAGWFLATVLEYLQWQTAATWALHVTVILVALTVVAALAAWVWREDETTDGKDSPD